MLPKSRRRPTFGRYLLAIVLAVGTCTSSSWGQVTEARLSASSTSETQRNAQYADLAHDVEVLQQQLSLVKRVVKLVTPTVVHVETQPLPKYRSRLQIEEEGSGVIVRFGSQYYVLTNRHVIRHSADEYAIRIQLADGRVVEPKETWTDRETDVAVMSIEADGLVPARFGDSDALEIGDFVLAVGSPFGLSQSVTRGIVSARGRYNLELGDGELKWQNFIQTDAAINPGNSGGPLINLRGEVVGINTAIASSSGGNEGIGFSIPINIVVRVARQLVETGKAARGFLGVRLDRNYNETIAHQMGLPSGLIGTKITAVDPESPAEKAELHVGDVILSYNGVRIERDVHLISLVKLTETGKRIDLGIFRDGEYLHKSVEIGDSSDKALADR